MSNEGKTSIFEKMIIVPCIEIYKVKLSNVEGIWMGALYKFCKGRLTIM